ncbi:hypothetical protein, partial [Fibrella rubiginis]|uniref:hypothetical protein n=1 Tax=Fibrella rubiginis TaxID=2817060 RepID=UPI001E56F277
YTGSQWWGQRGGVHLEDRGQRGGHREQPECEPSDHDNLPGGVHQLWQLHGGAGHAHRYAPSAAVGTAGGHPQSA